MSLANPYTPITVNQEEYVESLKLAIRSNINSFVYGIPGVGKTEMTMQVAEETDHDLHIYNLTHMDIIDFRIPNVDVKNNISRFAYSDTLPKKGDRPCIVFLDEINCIPTLMQPTAYTMVQEKRVGDYRFPPNTKVIGAGNREFDQAAANQMSGALKNRFGLVMNLKPDPEMWCNWAIKKDIPDYIRSFVLQIRTKVNVPGLGEQVVSPLEGYDPDSPCGGCTPRSLYNLSLAIKGGIPENLESRVFNGMIGELFGKRLFGWIKRYRSEINFDEILKNPKKAPIPKNDPELLYMIACGLADRSNGETFDTVMDYIERKDFSKTYEYIVIHTITNNPAQLPQISKNKRYIEYLKEHSEDLLGGIEDA